MASDDGNPKKRPIPFVEADYIPPSVSLPRAREPQPKPRQIWFYVLVTPLVAGLVAGAIAYNRHRSFGGVGHIEVNVNPTDATVWLDGKQVADHSPASLAVMSGAHDMAIARDGFVPIQQRVDVNAGEIVAVSVALVVAPPSARPKPVRHGPRPAKLPAKLDGVVMIDVGKGTADKGGGGEPAAGSAPAQPDPEKP
jgi:hypothetical protein